MKKFEFGYKCQDIITGFTGILTDRTMYITGCDRVGLTNEKSETKFFNHNTVKIINKGVFKELLENGCNKYSDLENALYDFGKIGIDKITEYKGKIVCNQLSTSGDISYGLSPKYNPSNRDNNANWFDEARIEVLEENKTEIKTDKKRAGGVSNPHGLSVR